MSSNQLIVLYLIGWGACTYVGMRIEAWRWQKRKNNDVERAYHRGWIAGRDFVQQISTERTELESAVTLLTGEEFPNILNISNDENMEKNEYRFLIEHPHNQRRP